MLLAVSCACEWQRSVRQILICLSTANVLRPVMHICSIYLPDIDECANSSALCDSNASCNNTEGSFACICDVGYTGNGSSCEGNCSIKIFLL